MLVLPAVDIAKGRCVRLLQGRPEDETVYFQSPLQAALHWQGLGAEALHVVDLDGALARGIPPDAARDEHNARPIVEILEGAQIPVEVAGGLRTTKAVRAVLEAGATRAVVGTRAVRDPEWAVALSLDLPGRIVIALDALEGRVAVEGWQDFVPEGPVELAKKLSEGRPAAFLYTDVSRDGMLTQPNYKGVEEMRASVDIPIIASGGVSSVHDIRLLGACGADAVVVGKALYEEKFALPEALRTAKRYASRLRPAPDGT